MGEKFSLPFRVSRGGPLGWADSADGPSFMVNTVGQTRAENRFAAAPFARHGVADDTASQIAAAESVV